MGYYNPFLQYGIENLSKECGLAGIDGLIVPDLPPEESGVLQDALNLHGLDLIYLLAPTSDAARVEQVIRRTTSFIYCVSVTGVTGARSTIEADGLELVSQVKEATEFPVALGFGISTPAHVREASGVADAVIVGSAFVDKINNDLEGDLPKVIATYVNELRKAL